MKTRELKVSVKVTVPKTVIDNTDEPYFYKIGFEKEDDVVKNEVENGVEAWFDGFELVEPRIGDDIEIAETGEETVTAKLHYTVLVEIL